MCCGTPRPIKICPTDIPAVHKRPLLIRPTIGWLAPALVPPTPNTRPLASYIPSLASRTTALVLSPASSPSSSRQCTRRARTRKTNTPGRLSETVSYRERDDRANRTQPFERCIDYLFFAASPRELRRGCLLLGSARISIRFFVF